MLNDPHFDHCNLLHQLCPIFKQVFPSCFSCRRTFLIARFVGPTWGPSGADRTQVGPCWPHELCSLGCQNVSEPSCWIMAETFYYSMDVIHPVFLLWESNLCISSWLSARYPTSSSSATESASFQRLVPSFSGLHGSIHFVAQPLFQFYLLQLLRRIDYYSLISSPSSLLAADSVIPSYSIWLSLTARVNESFHWLQTGWGSSNPIIGPNAIFTFLTAIFNESFQ